ncbi:MAG TPA: hypothetical protein VKZ76_02710 [Edaphocola sp.]|nr:hypothetical protein [Edaphocola sp.]
MRATTITLLLCLISLLGYTQETTKVETVKGKKLEWFTRHITVEAIDPKTGKTVIREILERTTLKSYDGVDVATNAPSSVHKKVNKWVNKHLKTIKRPKFHNRDMRIQFANYVVDTSGKLVYYEMLLYPYKQSLQLYPNEYTEEIKQYLKAIEDKINSFEGLGKQKGMIFVATPIEL